MESEQLDVDDGLGDELMREGFGPIIDTPGHKGVDFETRVDFDRLRAYRLARAREALDASEFGAILAL